jgi:hypothetical protein
MIWFLVHHKIIIIKLKTRFTPLKKVIMNILSVLMITIEFQSLEEKVVLVDYHNLP